MFYRNEFQLVKRLGCCGGKWWGGNHGYSWSLSFVTTLSTGSYVELIIDQHKDNSMISLFVWSNTDLNISRLFNLLFVKITTSNNKTIFSRSGKIVPQSTNKENKRLQYLVREKTFISLDLFLAGQNRK